MGLCDDVYANKNQNDLFVPPILDISSRRRRRCHRARNVYRLVPRFVFGLIVLLSPLLVAADKGGEENCQRVLPPSPDDDATPLCPKNATLYSLCGPERYCSNRSSTTTCVEEENDRSENHEPFLCLHKTLLFSKLSLRDILAFLIAFICCFVSAMAGIGGGGLILPLTILCLNFTTKEASVLSNTAVFANCSGQLLINYYNNCNTKNTDTVQEQEALSQTEEQQMNTTNTTAVDTNQTFVSETTLTVLVLFPSLIAGGSVAITLEGLVPSTAILILALFTLSLATFKTYKKAKQMRNDELRHVVVDDEQQQGGERGDSTTTTTTTQQQQQPEGIIAPVNNNDDETSHQQLQQQQQETTINNNTNTLVENYGSHNNYNTTTAATVEQHSIEIDNTDNTDNIPCCSCSPCCCCCFSNSTSLSSYSLIKNYHILEGLLFLCWFSDSVTFTFLRGNNIERCSNIYYFIISIPIIVAVLIISLGKHLIYKSQNCALHRTATHILGLKDSNTPVNEENGRMMIRPLLQEQESDTNNNHTNGLDSNNNNPQEIMMDEYTNESLNNNNGENNTNNETIQYVLKWWLPIIGFIIGLFAALLGIGGGELIGPILLIVLKMNPKLSTTITAIMSFLNSGTNTIHYGITKRIISPGYAILLLGTAGFLGGSCGRMVVIQMSSSTTTTATPSTSMGRPPKENGILSIFAFSLSIVLFIATCLIAYELLTSPPSWSSKSVC